MSDNRREKPSRWQRFLTWVDSVVEAVLGWLP